MECAENNAVLCSDSTAQGDIASRMHHLQQLLLRLVENCYFKEVEIFCGALGHLANILPQQTTARFSDWALECCKHESAEVCSLLPYIAFLMRRLPTITFHYHKFCFLHQFFSALQEMQSRAIKALLVLLLNHAGKYTINPAQRDNL